MVRLSIFEVTWKEMRVGEVRLDRAGDDVDGRALRRHDQVDAGGARHLREALDGAFDVLAGDHHQVGHLVDDDDDVGQRRQVHRLLREGRAARLLLEAGFDRPRDDFARRRRVLHAGVEPVDVADAEARHLLVAVLHLAHGPFQRDDGLFRVGDDGGEEMRDAVVDGEFQHLRIDHDQPAFVRPQPVEQREDHRIDGDGLARARRAGDEQMRHLGQFGDDRLAADRLAEAERELVLGAAEGGGFDHFAQIDGLAPLVRQFDADHVAAGHDGDAGRDGRHRAGDVVGEADDAGGFDAGRRLQFIERHDGAGAHVDDLAAHAKVFENALEQARVLFERIVGEAVAVEFLRLGQQIDRRVFIDIRVGRQGRCRHGDERRDRCSASGHHRFRPDDDRERLGVARGLRRFRRHAGGFGQRQIVRGLRQGGERVAVRLVVGDRRRLGCAVLQDFDTLENRGNDMKGGNRRKHVLRRHQPFLCLGCEIFHEAPGLLDRVLCDGRAIGYLRAAAPEDVIGRAHEADARRRHERRRPAGRFGHGAGGMRRRMMRRRIMRRRGREGGLGGLGLGRRGLMPFPRIIGRLVRGIRQVPRQGRRRIVGFDVAGAVRSAGAVAPAQGVEQGGEDAHQRVGAAAKPMVVEGRRRRHAVGVRQGHEADHGTRTRPRRTPPW